MKPQAIGVRHEEQRERAGEEDPEGEATVVGDAAQVGQKKGDKKNGNDNCEREAIRDDHATDAVTGLAEEGKVAARATPRRVGHLQNQQTHSLYLSAIVCPARRGKMSDPRRAGRLARTAKTTIPVTRSHSS